MHFDAFVFSLFFTEVAASEIPVSSYSLGQKITKYLNTLLFFPFFPRELRGYLEIFDLFEKLQLLYQVYHLFENILLTAGPR